MYHAAHVALVVLVRTEDVEVFQARDARQHARLLRVAIEEMLGIAVHVERPQALQRHGFRQAGLQPSVGCGRGSVDETPPAVEREMRQRFGVFEIIANQIRRVRFRGGRTGAQMKDGADVTEHSRRFADAPEQVVRFDVIGKLQRSQVLPLLVGSKKIRYEDVLQSAAIQLPNECAADETGAPSDKQPAFRKIGHWPCLTMSSGTFTRWRSELMVVPKIRSLSPLWPCEAITTRSGCTSRT